MSQRRTSATVEKKKKEQNKQKNLYLDQAVLEKEIELVHKSPVAKKKKLKKLQEQNLQISCHSSLGNYCG